MTPKKQEVPEQACLRQHLQRIRKAAKLTQQELAEKLSRPQSYISKIENGARGASFLEVSGLSAKPARWISGSSSKDLKLTFLILIESL